MELASRREGASKAKEERGGEEKRREGRGPVPPVQHLTEEATTGALLVASAAASPPCTAAALDPGCAGPPRERGAHPQRVLLGQRLPSPHMRVERTNTASRSGEESGCSIHARRFGIRPTNHRTTSQTAEGRLVGWAPGQFGKTAETKASRAVMDQSSVCEAMSPYAEEDRAEREPCGGGARREGRRRRWSRERPSRSECKALSSRQGKEPTCSRPPTNQHS